MDFVETEQAIVFPNGTTLKLLPHQTTFVSEGTLPKGGTWSLMPMPPTALGPCCISGPGDNATTPNKCIPHESCHGTPKGPCHACPQTPGTDCSRCDQVSTVEPGRYTRAGVPPFPAPCTGPNGKCEGVDWNGYAVKDVVKIPAGMKPGKYILGFRCTYTRNPSPRTWFPGMSLTDGYGLQMTARLLLRSGATART